MQPLKQERRADYQGRPERSPSHGRRGDRRRAAHASPPGHPSCTGQLIARRKDRRPFRLRLRRPGRMVDSLRAGAAPGRRHHCTGSVRMAPGTDARIFPTPPTSPSRRTGSAKCSSPGTRRLDLHEKRPVYAREGVSWLWLVDPADRTLETFELHDGHWLLIASAKDDDPVNIRPFDAVTFNLGRPLALTPEHTNGWPAFKTRRPPTPCRNDETLQTRACPGFRRRTLVPGSGFRVVAVHAVPVLQLRGTFCPAGGKRIRRSNTLRSPYNTRTNAKSLQSANHILTCFAPGPIPRRLHHNLAATCRDCPYQRRRAQARRSPRCPCAPAPPGGDRQRIDSGPPSAMLSGTGCRYRSSPACSGIPMCA